jgi:predicted outer membrane repeat protein
MVCLGILADCTFIANSANFGGGMYGWGSLTNCTFIGNSAREEGGGIHGSGWLTGCTFRRNSAGYRGGAMYICDEDVTFIDCLLEENSAGKSGGGVFVYQGKAELIDCILHGNSASQGGALASEGSFFILIDCSLTGNSASQSGGGVWNWGYRLIMMSCSITDNRAEQGGGISNTYGEAILTSCTLTGNCAFQSGGGLWNECGDLCLTNCTFAGNSADRGHAMIFNPWEQWCSTSIQLTNCILWDGGNEVWNNHYSAEITIAHSDVQGGPTAVYDPCNVIIWGNGNIDIDPCFVEPGYWDVNGIWVDGDYHLLASSPCIDAGDPNYIAEPNETDLDGRPRVINGRIDMGAYEYSPPIQADIRIIPRTINLRNKGQWIAAFLRLPEDYNVTDIDPNSIFLKNEIEPQWFWCDEEEQVVMVRFSREDVQAILDTGDIDLTITGRLTDGAAFKATDTIKVIGKAGKN